MNEVKKYSKTGVAIKYPITLEEGKVALVTGSDLIIQSAFDILSADAPRFFLGEYNSRLKELKFEQNDEVLLSLLQVFIYNALKKWETRTKVKNINFNVEEDWVDCEITHQIIGESTTESFVYPFYKNIIY